jgi:DNA repair protein RadD
MSSDEIQLLLGRLSPDVLRELIGEDRLDLILAATEHGERSVRQNAPALAGLLARIAGSQLLEDPRVRSHLLTLVPVDELRILALDLTGQAFDKSADNVLALAALPWRPSSEIALELVRRFALPSVYLPKSTPQTTPTSIVRPSPRRPPLRDYQLDIKERVSTLVKNGSTRVLVQMPTGAGKTRTMMDTLAQLATKEAVFAAGDSILWLAHVEELCEQAVEAFEDSWMEQGDAPVTVVRAWGTTKPNVADYGGAFIVGSYQKLVALRKQKGEFEHIRRPIKIIVADEAHKVMAPTFAALLGDLVTGDVILIGLTATPGRGLELGTENVQLASFFHKNLVGPAWSENPIKELRKRGILSRVRHRTIESDTDIMLSAAERNAAVDVDLPGSVLSRLATSSERNRRIVKAVRQELAERRSCLVFACTVEHSRALAAILTIEGERAAHVDASISKYQRKEIISAFRSGAINVLLNFGVLSTGFDVPRVSAVVIARPTTSVVLYSQMIGRGLRGPASGGGAECTLIDVRDNFVSFGAVDDVYSAFEAYWE